MRYHVQKFLVYKLDLYDLAVVDSTTTIALGIATFLAHFEVIPI